MTSFDDLEKSVDDSQPIELYQFTKGVETFRYTSAEDTITVGIDVFEPESIARNNILQGADQENRTLTVTVPTSNPFAVQYIDIVPGERASVEVFRYQRNEVPPFNTTILLFKGLVQSVRFPNDGHSAEIAIRSIETALNRNVPRFTYLSMCNHFLYDSRCGIDPTLFNHIGNVSAVTTNIICVDGAGASGFNFVGGFIKPVTSADYRVVLDQVTDDLTVLLPFPTNIVGTNVQVFAGCDHLVKGDCALVFDNVDEFGGFGFVPNRNVFEKGLQI